jgi:hypothetical protein
MNNEPVGVVTEFEGILVGTLFEQLPDGTKLYTHPSEHDLGIAEAIGFEKGHKSASITKTLTDEEIAKVAKDFYLSEYVPYDFAKAILKKAQEK